MFNLLILALDSICNLLIGKSIKSQCILSLLSSSTYRFWIVFVPRGVWLIHLSTCRYWMIKMTASCNSPRQLCLYRSRCSWRTSSRWTHRLLKPLIHIASWGILYLQLKIQIFRSAIFLDAWEYFIRKNWAL